MSEPILVVDGAATNRILLKVRLAGACYEVQTARSLDEAVELMRRRPFAVVIVGGDTSDASRVTICARLVAESLGFVPVIVMDGGSERLAALRAGAAAVIDRPLEESVLLARIRSVIRDAEPATNWPGPGGATLPNFPAGDFPGPFAGPYSRDHGGAAPHIPAAPGLAEAAAAFAGPATCGAGEIALIAACPQAGLIWRQHLQGRLSHVLRVMEPERALAEAASGRVPELYLIAAGIEREGDGLQLMSELRARPISREAAFAVVAPAERPDLMAITLDLGAGDVIDQQALTPDRADETALRLGALVARKRGADRRRRADEHNRRCALSDELTGIPNRRYAMARLAEMAAKPSEDTLAAVAVDIDHFKRINDRHGHAAGDAVLTAVAQRLQAQLPRGAFLARMGGEEFLAILPGADLDGATAMAERLRHAVAASPIRLPETSGSWLVPVTLSAGVAVTRCDALPGDTEGLMDRADRAMMSAKSAGRNRIGNGDMGHAA